MFFKREQPQAAKLAAQLDTLRSAGYEVRDGAGGSLVRRGGFAALVGEDSNGAAALVESGLALGEEIGLLTDLGYQKIFLTRGGKKVPALAEHLKGLHEFVEDVCESAGVTRHYNEGLGTTNEKHIYDRVEGRDHAPKAKAWERNAG